MNELDIIKAMLIDYILENIGVLDEKELDKIIKMIQKKYWSI